MLGAPGLAISITKASAEAATELAAFDAALLEAGVGNQNLIYLSSILPPGTTVYQGPPAFDETHFGNRLYCVLAQKRTSTPGEEAWAGIAWVQEKSSGRGLFAEIDGESEGEVRFQLESTLQEMMARRPEYIWGEIKSVVQGTRCTVSPVCSLVVAAYRSEGRW